MMRTSTTLLLLLCLVAVSILPTAKNAEAQGTNLVTFEMPEQFTAHARDNVKVSFYITSQEPAILALSVMILTMVSNFWTGASWNQIDWTLWGISLTPSPVHVAEAGNWSLVTLTFTVPTTATPGEYHILVDATIAPATSPSATGQITLGVVGTGNSTDWTAPLIVVSAVVLISAAVVLMLRRPRRRSRQPRELHASQLDAITRRFSDDYARNPNAPRDIFTKREG
jgi:hypothetical protein